MANKHLKRKSHNLRNQPAWWYEEKSGIALIHEHPSGYGHGDKTQTVIFIRWASLRAALTRKDKP